MEILRIRNWALHRVPAEGPVSSKRLLSPPRQGPANVLVLHEFQQNKVYYCQRHHLEKKSLGNAPVRVTAGLKPRAPFVNHMLFSSTKPYAEFSLKQQHRTGITKEPH